MPPMKRGAWPYAFQNPLWSQQPLYGFDPMTYPGAGPNYPGAFPYPPPGFPAFTWPIVPMPDARPPVRFPSQPYPQQRSLGTPSPLMAFLSGTEDQD